MRGPKPGTPARRLAQCRWAATVVAAMKLSAHRTSSTDRSQLVLGDDFPNVPPKGYFLTKTFHPNVSEAGEICVNVLKKDWNADLGIRHVLLVGVCRHLAASSITCLQSCNAARLPSHASAPAALTRLAPM